MFDITVGAFKGLWKFDEDMDGSLPDPADVKKRLELVGWKDIVVDKKKKTVFLKRKGMSITLGGIAKGYAVDKCVDAAQRRAASPTSWCRPAATCTSPATKGDEPWVVGIRDPRGQHDAMFALAPIKDHSFSTSGDYERGFVKDGVRYHHILDPRNGQPAHASRSVTIRAKDAFTADAWSKVMFILGWKEGDGADREGQARGLRGRVGRRQERGPHDAGHREGRSRSSSSRRRARSRGTDGSTSIMCAGASQRVSAASTRRA